MSGTARRPNERYDREALVGFLDTISFDFFCTFTTRLPISVPSARRIAGEVCKHIDAPESASVFWVAEPFDTREGCHFHALIKADINKFEVFNWYYGKFGRCQLIDNREPDRQLAASYYFSKYTTKGFADYDMLLSRKHGFPQPRDRKLERFDRTMPLAGGLPGSVIPIVTADAAARLKEAREQHQRHLVKPQRPLDPLGNPIDPNDCPF